MTVYAPERIRKTRARLRERTIRTILKEFDKKLMELPRESRLQKYLKMAESPFRFYRGSAYLFYYDVTNTPFAYHTPPEKPTWIQGDLHFENFGGFRNENGVLVYDVNDFDEGYIGSYLYDILRMAASIVLVAEQQQFAEAEQKAAVDAYLVAYCEQMRKFAAKEADPATFQLTGEHASGPIGKVLRKLKQRQSDHLLQGVTALVQDHRQFTHTEEILPMDEDMKRKLMEAWPGYVSGIDPAAHQDETFYRIKDLVVKHGSGTASIGLDRFYALIEGESGSAANDDLILEIKEVRAPIPAYLLEHNESFWDMYPHQGHRVIATHQAMHHQADGCLGYLTIDGRHFYVRERSPYKKRVKTKNIRTLDDLLSTVCQMGQISAKIHARADADLEHRLLDYHSEDVILESIGKDAGPFRRRVVLWAMAYARQVHVDYELFCGWLTNWQAKG